MKKIIFLKFIDRDGGRLIGEGINQDYTQPFGRGKKRQRRYMSNRGNNSYQENDQDSEELNSSVCSKLFCILWNYNGFFSFNL